MLDLINKLKNYQNVEINDSGNYYLIKIHLLSRFYFELAIFEDNNEYCIELLDFFSKESLWIYRADIYESGDITKAMLPQFFEECIVNDINKILSATDFQIKESVGIKIFGKRFMKRKLLFYEINGEWREFVFG